MSSDINYSPTTTWAPGALAEAERDYEAHRDGFVTLMTAAKIALESGRPPAVIAEDLARALDWMSHGQATLMLATVATDAARKAAA